MEPTAAKTEATKASCRRRKDLASTRSTWANCAEGGIRSDIDDRLALATGLSAAEQRVQQRGRQQGPYATNSLHAGPVCCNGWFGPLLSLPQEPVTCRASLMRS